MKAELVQELHDWSRTEDPEFYKCENCGRFATIDEEEFTAKCPKADD